MLAALSIALHLADAQGVPRDELLVLLADMGRAVERETAARAIVDEPYAGECTGPNRCATEILGRTGGQRLVFVTVFGAATRVRVLAERADERGVVSATVQADLPKERARWAPGLEGVARILFPEEAATKPALVEVPAPAPVQERGGRALAWTAVGSGAVAVGLAAAFRAVSEGARSDVATMPLAPDELASAQSRSRAFGLASNLLFGFAAAAITGGAVYLLAE